MKRPMGTVLFSLVTAKGRKKELLKPLKAILAKANTSPKKDVVEFRDFKAEFEGEIQLGQSIKVDEVFEGRRFSGRCIGQSKGKGFQGVVKRHNFAGVGDQTHGQHNRLRAPGSIGGASYPARVFKGMRMAGRTGGDRVKVLNLKVMKIVPEENLIVVSGSIPGAKNSTVILEK